MITRDQFEILHKSWIASFEAFEQQSLAMEMIVFGDECHSGWNSPHIPAIHAKLKKYKDAMREAIDKGFDRSWIELTKLSMFIRQADRQIERHIRESKASEE